MTAGRPKSFKTLEELEKAIEDYFNEGAYMEGGDGRVFAPTMAGLARHLKVDRKTIVNYGHDQEYFRTIKEARSRVEEFLEQKLYGNTVTGVIFNLKNNFGWKDKTEQELTGADGGPIKTDNQFTVTFVGTDGNTNS